MHTVNKTINNVIDALADFLQPFCGQSEIIRAQTNRTPIPSGEFVVLTEILQVELETPITIWDETTQEQTFLSPTRIDVQIDFYGPNAGDYCKAATGVLRTEHACSQFPAGIKPLYASDGVQSPLVTGEQQWLTRWTITASLQYNPNIVVPSQTAVALAYNFNKASDIK